MDDLDILRHVQARRMPTSVVVITAHGSINIAVEAMKEGAFDFIGHEHLGLYFLSALNKVLRSEGMEVVDVSRNSLNGGSMRAYVAHRGAFTTKSTVDHLLFEETAYRNEMTYHGFARRAERVKDTVFQWMEEAKAQGKTVFAYGASTRGMTTLQYCGLDTSHISAAVDRNPEKVGKYIAGMNIPVVAEEDARASWPAFMLVLPWSFIDAFVKREKVYLDGGGQFVVPLPEPRVIGGVSTMTTSG